MARTDAALARANNRLFAHFGEEAVLRGGERITVVVSQNVAIVGEYGQIESLATTATFSAANKPRARDTLHILAGPSAGLWSLDEPTKRDGAHGVIEWVLVPVSVSAP
ncbi:MAG: hypothetical protein RBT67_07700 [Thauera sp.]|nr:hypothetical protein [Thauera sp.]